MAAGTSEKRLTDMPKRAITIPSIQIVDTPEDRSSRDSSLGEHVRYLSRDRTSYSSSDQRVRDKSQQPACDDRLVQGESVFRNIDIGCVDRHPCLGAANPDHESAIDERITPELHIAEQFHIKWSPRRRLMSGRSRLQERYTENTHDRDRGGYHVHALTPS